MSCPYGKERFLPIVLPLRSVDRPFASAESTFSKPLHTMKFELDVFIFHGKSESPSRIFTSNAWPFSIRAINTMSLPQG